MSKSYEKVNYLLRLRKQIERKIIVETLQTFSPIINIAEYLYFGFGSVYFADFILFHKHLNIKLMSSIDDKEEDEQRFKFNKPYKFIDFKIAKSQSFLETELNWKEKLFMWLDYDDPLDIGMIEDVELIAAKAKPFDLIFITVEAVSPEKPEDFIKSFGTYLPPTVTVKAIKENFPGRLREVMTNSINNGLGKQVHIKRFLQIFNILYKDTKAMYTFGGLFCDEDKIEQIKDRLSKLFYISHGDKIVRIDCPLLTPKEKLHLDSCVKKDNICQDLEDKTGLKPDDISKYGQFYKYYPQFFESVY